MMHINIQLIHLRKPMLTPTVACGAVTCVKTIRNPITAARFVMEKSPHCFLRGDDVDALAASVGLQTEPSSYFQTPHRQRQLKELQASAPTHVSLDHSTALNTTVPSAPHKMGTVGAVVRDSHGNLAAATSTGGMCNKVNDDVYSISIVIIHFYSVPWSHWGHAMHRSRHICEQVCRRLVHRQWRSIHPQVQCWTSRYNDGCRPQS